jgi:hypothetical protein
VGEAPVATTRSRFRTGLQIPDAYERCSENFRPLIIASAWHGSWSSRQHGGALELPMPSDPNKLLRSISSCDGTRVASNTGDFGAIFARRQGGVCAAQPAAPPQDLVATPRRIDSRPEILGFIRHFREGRLLLEF